VHWVSLGGIIRGVIQLLSGTPRSEKREQVSAEENKALVRREQQELWNHTGNLDAAQELFAAEEAEAARQEAADYRRGFPDVANTIEDLIAEGDKVVARWRSRATHQGGYMGIPRLARRWKSRASRYIA
jgi:predicted ester cyclase